MAKPKTSEPAEMAAGASEENARESKDAEPEDAKAEPKAKKQLSDGDRIDAIIEVLAANGMSLPKKLR